MTVKTITILILLVAFAGFGKADEQVKLDYIHVHPESDLKITNWSMYSSWGGVGIINNVTIENSSDIAYKNPKVQVCYTAPAIGAIGIIAQETGVLQITIPPNSKQTYLKGGATFGSKSQSMMPHSIRILKVTPVID